MPRAMKDSGIEWLGDIPATWKTIKFKYLHNGLNTGEGIDKDYWSTEENDTVFYTAGLAPIKTNYKNFPSWKYTKKNDLLLARNGTPYVYYPVEGACYTDHIIRAEMKETVNKKFIVYSLQQSISSVVVESVSLATWSASLWNEQKIPFPPLDEQRRIAAFLDDKCARIDSVIEKTRASIVEYKRLKQSIITRAVTKGIRPARPMKDSGVEWLGDIPADWELVPIKYLCSYNDEVLQENTDPDFTFDYIEIGSVEFGRGIIEMQRIRFADAPARARRIVHENDIIVSTVRTYLKAVASIPHSDIPLIASTGFVVIRPRNVNHIFLKYAILSSTTISKIEANSVGISYPAINASQVVRFKIPVPPLEEQKEIAAYLDGKTAAIDSLIEKKGGLVTELESLKKSLIFEYVTGKKEAPT